MTDPGKHYRFHWKGLQLDPARIAIIYGIANPMQFTILKKVLCAGNRGHKDAAQDYKDIISAAERAIEIIEEDENA